MSSDSNPLYLIKTFIQLVKYLRDELDWPIESDDFEELTFDYAAEELGLDAVTAVKVTEIKQLRPLTNKQPWGIFFVNFAPKQLPVVALRRILSTLVIKKRHSANKSQQAAWRLHDLLFISSYGETEHRDITFAHFAEEQGTGDLPTLRLLGWDDEDTKLKLDFVERELKAKLRWPEDENNVVDWRAKWSTAFRLRPREVIKTSQQLAIQLADLARGIRKRANNVLTVESAKGPLRKMHAAFKEALIHDLTTDDFADMYAQTIAYGLLTARISRPAGLVADNLADMVPVTNPFLKDLLETFLTIGGRKGKIDFDELGINDVVQLLRDADMEAVLRDFGDRNPQEDPVIHFYELFLKEYDAKKRMQRGVFYTPRPVVSFIVRGVHEILQKEFGLLDGLADITSWATMASRHKGLEIPRGVSPDEPFVQILDPATGTGTFLVEAIAVIRKTMEARWEMQGHMALEFNNLWNKYVPKHLLPRLHGYELLMAPYAIAHMKIGLKLSETGYRFDSPERARIYLTNALEPARSEVKQREFEQLVPALAHEARAVNAIKSRQRFTVVIGNPPYANFGQLNRIPFILELLDDYKSGLEEKKLNLDDDFIKFLRFSQYQIQRTGLGTVGFITNNVYADGLTHRRMRQSLMETFNDIHFLDLHGSSKRLEQAPGGAKDENVFDITVGVGIALMTKYCSVSKQSCAIVHGESWGKRSAKYDSLVKGSIEKTVWTTLLPHTPYFFFVPKDFADSEEYHSGFAIQDVFPVFSSGIQTKRDNVAVAETKEKLITTLEDFARLSPKELRLAYDLPEDGRDWKIEWASSHAKEILRFPKALARILYRPFDSRWTVMDSRSKGFVAYPRFELMSQMLQPNLGLILTRQLSLPSFQHVFATRQVIDGNTISMQTREYNYLFPLYLRNERVAQHSLSFDGKAQTNLGSSFLNKLSDCLKLRREANGLPHGLVPEDIFHYAYAVLHSPGYRDRYAEFLKIDFPRLPLTGNLDLFRSLSRHGSDLVALHLLESPKLNEHLCTYIGPKEALVEKPTYARDTVWLNKGQTYGFKGVPEAIWGFHVGGYQVCEKWLKDRKGRKLSKEDINHYNKIVVALSETVRLMKRIDEVIDEHGGWPNAFASAQQSTN